MALSWKTRRRLAIFILLVALPAYIILAVNIVALFGARPPFLIELAVYVGLGIVWILPLKKIFLGVGQAEPPEERQARSGGNSRGRED